MAARAAPFRRQVRTTVLLVGEGFSEVELLKHLRSLYTTNGNGFTAAVRNAHGKGAGNVVDHAIRQARQAEYDHKAVLLDTDADWTEAVRRRARSESIVIIQSAPCLEAWLLDVRGHGRERGSAEHKREFLVRCGFPAHDARVYPQHFTREFWMQPGHVSPRWMPC